jgi:hypothetical protein
MNRPKALTQWALVARNLTLQEFIEEATYLWQLPIHKLKAVADDKNTPAGRMAIARVLFNAANNGDAKALAVLLDRMIGRPKQIEVKPDEEHPLTGIMNSMDESELDRQIKELEFTDVEPTE